MISLSHWGMFEVQPAVLMIPNDFKFSNAQLADWRRPDGVVWLRKDQPVPCPL